MLTLLYGCDIIIYHKISEKTMSKTSTKIIGTVFTILGTCVLINALIYSLLSNPNLGSLLTLALGAFLTIVGIFFTKIISKIPGVALITVLVLFCIAFSLFLFLYIFGSVDTSCADEDALIVLGCGVKGDEPGQNLKDRLNRAILYHQENPDALIIVSGGKGDDENVSEAFAMEQYLIKHGVPAEIIIKEDRATSTEENFLYSKEILDEYFEEHYKVAFITNDFHIYRSSVFAKLTGFANVTSTHADTTWYTVLPNGLRECITVLKLWILDQHKY